MCTNNSLLAVAEMFFVGMPYPAKLSLLLCALYTHYLCNHLTESGGWSIRRQAQKLLMK
jgi:hypothetical protein